MPKAATDSKGWLRGVDLNHRPLGYEPNGTPLSHCYSIGLTRLQSLKTTLSTSSFGAKLVPLTNTQASPEFASKLTDVPCVGGSARFLLVWASVFLGAFSLNVRAVVLPQPVNIVRVSGKNAHRRPNRLRVGGYSHIHQTIYRGDKWLRPNFAVGSNVPLDFIIGTGMQDANTIFGMTARVGGVRTYHIPLNEEMLNKGFNSSSSGIAHGNQNKNRPALPNSFIKPGVNTLGARHFFLKRRQQKGSCVVQHFASGDFLPSSLFNEYVNVKSGLSMLVQSSRSPKELPSVFNLALVDISEALEREAVGASTVPLLEIIVITSVA